MACEGVALRFRDLGFAGRELEVEAVVAQIDFVAERELLVLPTVGLLGLDDALRLRFALHPPLLSEFVREVSSEADSEVPGPVLEVFQFGDELLALPRRLDQEVVDPRHAFAYGLHLTGLCEGERGAIALARLPHGSGGALEQAVDAAVLVERGALVAAERRLKESDLAIGLLPVLLEELFELVEPALPFERVESAEGVSGEVAHSRQLLEVEVVVVAGDAGVLVLGHASSYDGQMLRDATNRPSSCCFIGNEEMR